MFPTAEILNQKWKKTTIFFLILPASSCRGLTSLCQYCHHQVAPCKNKTAFENQTWLPYFSSSSSSKAARSSHLEAIDLSAEFARSHGFFAPSSGQNE